MYERKRAHRDGQRPLGREESRVLPLLLRYVPDRPGSSVGNARAGMGVERPIRYAMPREIRRRQGGWVCDVGKSSTQMGKRPERLSPPWWATFALHWSDSLESYLLAGRLVTGIEANEI